MDPLTETHIAFPNRFLFAPVRGFFLYFGPHYQQLLPHGLQLIGKCIGLFTCRCRRIGDNDRSLFTLVLPFGSIDQETCIFITCCDMILIFYRIGRVKAIQRCHCQVLGKIGRIGRNEMDPRIIVDSGKIALCVHPFIDETQASALFGLHMSAETIRQIIHHAAE
jgi:hypothetical protein